MTLLSMTGAIVKLSVTTGMLRSVVLTLICSSGSADLFDRGGGLIYDDVLDITWLADANLAASNTFGVPGIGVGGAMNWNTAQNWIAAMNTAGYLGYSDWRLPATLDPDSSCTDDIAGTIPSTDPTGLNCTGCEMGQLFYIELGGTAGDYIMTSSDPDLALFSNIQEGLYWSDTEYAPNPLAGAWHFHFDSGFQNTFNKLATLFAWPVHDGDIGMALIPDGDLNLDGQVDAGDILIVMRIALGFMTATPEQMIHGDVAPLNAGSPNPDGIINAADVLLVKGKALGTLSFP